MDIVDVADEIQIVVAVAVESWGLVVVVAEHKATQKTQHNRAAFDPFIKLVALQIQLMFLRRMAKTKSVRN